MGLLIVAILGAACGYLAIWSAVIFQKTFEERVKTLLMTVVVDAIMLLGFAYAGQGAVFTTVLIFKYLFLAVIDFDKTLRQ